MILHTHLKWEPFWRIKKNLKIINHFIYSCVCEIRYPRYIHVVRTVRSFCSPVIVSISPGTSLLIAL